MTVTCSVVMMLTVTQISTVVMNTFHNDSDLHSLLMFVYGVDVHVKLHT